VVAGSCAGVYALAVYVSHPHDSAPPVPQQPPEFGIEGLIVAAADLNLGEVWETDSFWCSLPLRNDTEAEKCITDFQTSCGCLQVEPRAVTIRPHQTTTIRLKLDLSHRTMQEINRVERPFAVEFRPLLRTTPSYGPGWRLHGTIKSRLIVDALALHFGESFIQGQTPPTRQLTASLHVQADGVVARVDPPLASVAIVRNEQEPTRLTLQVTPSDTLPVGPFKATVTLEVVDETGASGFGAILPVAGEVRPEVCPLPAQLFLGAHPVGSTAEATMILQVPQGKAWIVDHIETDSPDMHIEKIAVEGLASGRAFRVRQDVKKLGDQSSVIRFVVREGEHAPKTVTTKVFYLGEPELGRQARKP
jgi:hypothetical protein